MKLWPIILIMLFGNVMPLSANDAPPPSDKMIALLAEEEKAAEEHLSAPPHLIGTAENQEGILSWLLLGIAAFFVMGSVMYWVWDQKKNATSAEPSLLTSPTSNEFLETDRIPGQAKPTQTETVAPPTPAISQADQRFLLQVRHILDTHMVDPEFNAEAFCIEMNMSKSQFYRKFQDLKGQSPGKFIREKRLEKAYSMLKNGEGNVSEVAYAVGFNNLSYFAKCFRNEFGLPPSHV